MEEPAISPITSLLHQRSFGMTSSRTFRSNILSSKTNLRLSETTHISSAHRLSVDSVQIDRNENRFLLAASRDSTVSVYDISKWGSDHYLQGRPITKKPKTSVYPAIAHSLPRRTDPFVNAQWHPADTGAFVTASAQGSVSVWDTDAMRSVVNYQPLSSIYCMHLSPLLGRSQNIAAVGAKLGDNSTGVKLVDLQSGATSHSLVGHQGGITAVQWSPVSDVVLASGSIDGTIRLWDIRKSGARSCVCVLDRDADSTSSPSRPCKAHYAHLIASKHKKSPNNFRRNESTAAVSHGGSVTAVAFGEDGLTLVSTGTDGKLQVWDLRGNAHLLPISFRYRGQNPPVSRMNQRVPLIVKQYGRETLAWVGVGSRILGYSLERGGLPTRVLEGHMLMVTALDVMDHTMQLISAANDGMILAWDPKQCSSAIEDDLGRGIRRNNKRSRESAQAQDRDSW